MFQSSNVGNTNGMTAVSSEHAMEVCCKVDNDVCFHTASTSC